MKKAFLLIVACIFAFVNAQAQSSEVEAASQKTKVEEFKLKNSFIKEDHLYKHDGNGLKVIAKLITDLKTKEQIVALEFWPSTAMKVLGGAMEPLGYLDMEHVDDFILALETILAETQKADKKDVFSITYTAPGGIDVSYMGDIAAPILVFRKKWHTVNEYGVPTCVYTANPPAVALQGLPKLIAGLKEAQAIAQQSLGK